MHFDRMFNDVRTTLVIAVLTLLCIVLGFSSLYLWLTGDRTVISDDSIREEIVPVAKLTTYEYNFTQVLFLSESGNPLNINNPITTKRYVATIDGSAPIQLDAEQITCRGEYQGDRLRKVAITMPHSYVGDITLFHETAKKYVEDNGFLNLNQVSTDDLNTLYSQTEKEQRKKLEESSVLKNADERAQELIEAQIHSIHGEDVEVSFDFIDA